jgi:hypothetical protein
LAVSVPYTVSGSANNPADHALSNGTISIAAGQTSGTVTFNVFNDTLDESDETVIVRLGAPTNATLGTTTEQTITIVDNDTAAISWSVATQAVNESGTVTLTASLSGASTQAVVANISVGGNATQGTDYSFPSPTPTNLSVPAGSLSASLTLTIANDTLNEDNETIVLTLSSSGGSTIGSIPTQTVTINDNDALPTVQWSVAAASASETSATGTSAVLQLSAASGRAVTVPLTLSGTATSGQDYNVSAPVTIPAGMASLTVPIAMINDATLESDETAVLTLGAVTGATPMGRTALTVTIEDDENRNDPRITAFRNSVYVITRRDCAGCHATSISPFHASANVIQAYDFAKTEVNNFMGDLRSTQMVIRTTNGHGGCGAACMTNGNEMFNAVTAWAAAEGTGPAPSPTPGSGVVLETADTQLRAANRHYVKGVLDEVFGNHAEVTATTTNLILNERGLFGGPCEHYGNTFNSTPREVNGPLGNCKSFGDSQIPLMPGGVSGKFSLTIRACEKILNYDATNNNRAVRSAASQVGVTDANLPYPTAANVTAAYGLFYPGKSPSADATTALMGIVNAAQTANYGGLDAWRYMLLALCRAPDWQVP